MVHGHKRVLSLQVLWNYSSFISLCLSLFSTACIWTQSAFLSLFTFARICASVAATSSKMRAEAGRCMSYLSFWGWLMMEWSQNKPSGIYAQCLHPPFSPVWAKDFPSARILFMKPNIFHKALLYVMGFLPYQTTPFITVTLTVCILLFCIVVLMTHKCINVCHTHDGTMLPSIVINVQNFLERRPVGLCSEEIISVVSWTDRVGSKEWCEQFYVSACVSVCESKTESHFAACQ